jgi:hypothetical protein
MTLGRTSIEKGIAPSPESDDKKIINGINLFITLKIGVFYGNTKEKAFETFFPEDCTNCTGRGNNHSLCKQMI